MTENKGWCKIIETEKRDFLVERGYDAESKNQVVILSTHTNVCHLRITIGNGDSPSMDHLYQSVTIDTVEKMLNKLLRDSPFDSLESLDEEE